MPPLEHDKYYHIYNRGNNREDLFSSESDYQHFLSLYEKYVNPVAFTFAWVLMKNHFHVLIRIKSEEEIGIYLPLKSDGSNNYARFQTSGNLRNNSTGNNLTESAGPVRVIPENSTNSTESGPNPSINSDRSKDSVRLSRTYSINSDRSKDSVRLRKPNPTLHFSHLFNAYTRYYNLKYERTGALYERSFKRIEVDSIDYFRKLVVYIHTNPVHHGFTDDFKEYSWSSYHNILSDTPTTIQRQEVIDWFGDIENLKIVHQMRIDSEQFQEILLE